MARNTEFWTHLRINRLRAGVARNERRAEIAEAIGCTRSAVIGKARRLGLSVPREMDFSDVKRRARLDRRNQLAKLRLFKRKEADMTNVPSRRAWFWRPPCFTAPKPAGGPVTIFDLNETTCRWPLWPNSARPLHTPIEQLLYCGEAVSEPSVYCRKHRDAANGRRDR
jgi:hypothetical protein